MPLGQVVVGLVAAVQIQLIMHMGSELNTFNKKATSEASAITKTMP